MTDTRRSSSNTARRRQYLLLLALGALIAGTAILSVALTGGRSNTEPATRPQSTHILAPGAQVDPKDAWRGQADAQLRSIEQKSREVGQRNTELERQNKDMLERLKKLEQSTLTPLPPPPVPAPPLRPNFGPDRLPTDLPDAASLRPLPPPPPRLSGPTPSAVPGTLPTTTSAPAPAGIVSITLADGPAAKTTKGTPDTGKTTPLPVRDTRRYIPSGSFSRAVLLGGLDAPTGGQAQRNPQPVLLRLIDHAVLPNQFRARIKECFVVGAGYGDVSAERAYVRTESLSCVTRDGQAIDVPLKGYVTGEDGKAGMRGRLVSKQGQILANALMAGIASGIGHAFQQGSTTFSVSPLGSTSNVDSGRQLEAGLGTGVGRALDRLAGYYISLAEKVFPVIEIDAGRTVDVVITQGLALTTALDAQNEDRAAFPHLADRTRQLRRPDDDTD